MDRKEYDKSGVTLHVAHDAAASLYSSHVGGGGLAGFLQRPANRMQAVPSHCQINR